MPPSSLSVYTLEPLEPRKLLSVSGPFPVTVTVFNDLNRDGVRNSNEPGLANWGVIALELRDANGNLHRGEGRTDTAGQIGFSDWIIDGVESGPSARVYVEPNKRYYSTTHQRATSGWFGVSGATIEFGLTDVAPIKGNLQYSYPREDGTFAGVPLAGRRVYEDANLNGKWDRDEKFAVTDLEGNYTMWLRSGTHTLRVEAGNGWTAPAGQKLVRTAVTLPYQNFPTFSTVMINPTKVDVLAAYTRSAGDVLRTNPLDDMFRETNRIYGNSNTNVLINLKGFHRTLYNESGDIETDLRRLQRRNDGHLDDVITQREQLRADLTVLMTDRSRTDGEVVGLAYQFARGGGGDNFAFGVVTIDAFERGWTLAHELAHNLGAGHDRATAAEHNDTPLEPYAYGYRFTAGEPKRVFKDIMAYGPGTTLPFFSTPHFKWLGKPIGTADGADNARVVREIAPLVAAYR